MTAIAIRHKHDILQSIRDGLLLREIASQYGVSKQALHQALKDLPEYRDAQQEQVESLIEQAKIETWAAKDPIDISRAREISKWAFRYAESVNPGKWSPQSRVQVEQIGDRADDLRAAKARLIEGVVVDKSVSK